jgi:hypothetical protein
MGSKFPISSSTTAFKRLWEVRCMQTALLVRALHHSEFDNTGASSTTASGHVTGNDAVG